LSQDHLEETREQQLNENIYSRFQRALKEYGVADLDVFQTVDLYEKKDIAQVTTTLFALGRTVSFSQFKVQFKLEIRFKYSSFDLKF